MFWSCCDREDREDQRRGKKEENRSKDKKKRRGGEEKRRSFAAKLFTLLLQTLITFHGVVVKSVVNIPSFDLCGGKFRDLGSSFCRVESLFSLCFLLLQLFSLGDRILLSCCCHCCHVVVVEVRSRDGQSTCGFV